MLRFISIRLLILPESEKTVDADHNLFLFFLKFYTHKCNYMQSNDMRAFIHINTRDR